MILTNINSGIFNMLYWYVILYKNVDIYSTKRRYVCVWKNNTASFSWPHGTVDVVFCFLNICLLLIDYSLWPIDCNPLPFLLMTFTPLLHGVGTVDLAKWVLPLLSEYSFLKRGMQVCGIPGWRGLSLTHRHTLEKSLSRRNTE